MNMSFGAYFFKWPKSVLMLSGRMFTFVLICSMFLLSCSKGENGTQKATQKIPQQCAGTLPVRIVPESPTAADDLHAVFGNGGGVTYAWEKNGTVVESENTPWLSKNRIAKHDKVTVIVRKGNEKGSATVIIGNSLPKVTSVNFIPADIYRGTEIKAVPVVSHADGDEVRFDYKWLLNGEELSENAPVLHGDKFKKGDAVSLTVIPYDFEGAGSPYKTRAVTIPNAKPFFISTPPAEFNSSIYTYQAVANDPDGDNITYSLASAPGGMVIDPKTGMIKWRLTAEHSGAHVIEVIASDSDGAQVTQRYSFSIKSNGGIGQ